MRIRQLVGFLLLAILFCVWFNTSNFCSAYHVPQIKQAKFGAGFFDDFEKNYKIVTKF